MSNQLLAERIWTEIFRELNGRGGFDAWWYEIDEDIQQELNADVIARIERILNG